MTSARWPWWAIALAGCLVTAGEATAGRGFVVVTWGDTISPVGDVSPRHRTDPRVTKVGYRYGYAGLFWVDLWTWGGTYCVYDGGRYAPIDPATAAALMDRPEGDLGRPFLYSCPLGWIILGPLAAVLAAGAVRARRRARAFARLFEDPEYQTALRMLGTGPPAGGATDPAPARPADGFAAAVEHLVRAGVAPPAEAEANLAAMLHALAAAERERREFPLPCVCGATLTVTTGMAGSTTTCACGRQVQVPPLRELRAL